MSLNQKQPNILFDIRLELLIYRIVLLSPFEFLRNKQLYTTWKIKLYMYTLLVLYTSLRVSFCLLFADGDATVKFFVYHGLVWMFVYFFDYVFSAVSVYGIALNGIITNIHQIEFFQQLHNFDVMLIANFGIPIKRSPTRSLSSCALIASLVYNFVAF